MVNDEQGGHVPTLHSLLFFTGSTSKCLHIMPYSVSYIFTADLVMVTILFVFGII